MGRLLAYGSSNTPPPGLGGKGFFGIPITRPANQTWTLQAGPGGQLGPPSAALGKVIAADPTNRNLNVSTDGGVTFTSESVTGANPSFAAYGGSNVWVATADRTRYFRSTDFGVTWTGPLAFPAVVGVNDFNFIASDGAGRFVAFAGDTPPSPNTNLNYVVSSDNGLTWSAPQVYTNRGWSGLIWDGAQFVALAFQAGTSAAVVATSPTGSAWTETVLGANYTQGISFDSLVTNLYLVGINPSGASPTIRVASTPAGLASASDVATGLHAGTGLQDTFTQNGVFWAFDPSGGVAKSTDSGVTWHLNTLNSPFNRPANYVCYDAVNARYIACTTRGDVMTFP